MREENTRSLSVVCDVKTLFYDYRKKNIVNERIHKINSRVWFARHGGTKKASFYFFFALSLIFIRFRVFNITFPDIINNAVELGERICWREEAKKNQKFIGIPISLFFNEFTTLTCAKSSRKNISVFYSFSWSSSSRGRKKFAYKLRIFSSSRLIDECNKFPKQLRI